MRTSVRCHCHPVMKARLLIERELTVRLARHTNSRSHAAVHEEVASSDKPAVRARLNRSCVFVISEDTT